MKCLLSLLVVSSVITFAEEPQNVLKPPYKMESWRLEEHEGGKGALKVEEKSLVISSTKVTGTDWHVQAVMTGIELTEGKEYLLRFKTKADGFVNLGVNMGIDEEDWHTVGLSEQLSVGKTAAQQEFRFRAENVHTKGKNRLTFVIGYETCQVTITDLVLSAAK